LHGGKKGGEVGGSEDGVVIYDEEVGERGKLLQGMLACEGKASSEAEILS